MAPTLENPRTSVRPSNVAPGRARTPNSRQGRPDLTSPLSVRTAPTGPEISSSQTSIASPTFTSKKEAVEIKKYRDAKALPYELRHHCLVYFEEQLYTSALALLNNIVSSGTSYPFPSGPAYAPPTSYLALTNTLIVHPLLTTRACSTDRLNVSSEALILLKNILAIIGPIHAKLVDAFAFSSTQSISLRQGSRLNVNEKRSTGKTLQDDDGGLVIISPLADESSLWKRAQDFWHAVGWAFNCSIKYPRRWQYWRVWLEYMLDVLDSDWKERSRIDSQPNELKREENPLALPVRTFLEDSILLTYLAGQGKSSTTVRRVVRSIFADGSEEDLRAFPEVFDKETKTRIARGGIKRKRGNQVDIEEDNYGDYTEVEDEDNQDSMDVSRDVSPRNRAFGCICGEQGKIDDEAQSISCEKCHVWQHLACVSIKRAATFGDGFYFVCKTCQKSSVESDWGHGTYAPILGETDAVVLRLRLLGLLSRACHSAPASFTSNTELYPMLFEYISPLPLPIFSLFVSPTRHLQDDVVNSLVQSHLARLLPKSSPIPYNEDLDQETLETCFLPFAASASSTKDNAKVSILVESLFRLLNQDPRYPMQSTPGLTAAVEKGIHAREAKLMDGRRKKAAGPKSKEEVADRFWLDSSAERLRHLVYFVRMRNST